MVTWTKTETLRRIVTATREARAVAGLPSNCKVEIGSRVIPTFTHTRPESKDEALSLGYPEGDDLIDMYSRNGDYWDAEGRRTGMVGAVLHLYLYRQTGSPYYGIDWDLDSVVTVWLGSTTEPAQVIDSSYINYTN